MSNLIADLRYSFRSLLKSPGLTLAADPGTIRIAAMENRDGANRSWSYPNFKDFRDRATLMEVVAQDDQTFNVAVDESAARSAGLRRRWMIALLASWIPGRRAGKVDALVALRYE